MTMRIARAGLVAMIALGLVAPAAVWARPGGAVTITLDADFLTTGEENFTAEGAFCDWGTASTDDFWVVGNGFRGLSFHVVKTLTCGDGSGSITIELDAATHAGSGGVLGGWRANGGTGDYAGATGGGVVVGVYDESGVIDVYTGRLNR